ncbi:MAG: hypothetical protein M0R03_19205 [Novosphingobium sp.]|jgi:hypothetical protein|nr:hypothetical protein [Novosphingobium sp.]
MSAYNRSWQTYARGLPRTLGDKARGILVSMSEETLRLTHQKNPSIPYMAPVYGYLANTIGDVLYNLIFDTKTEHVAENIKEQDSQSKYNVYNPRVSKEMFFKIFKDELVNTNRFYVEFVANKFEDESISNYKNVVSPPSKTISNIDRYPKPNSNTVGTTMTWLGESARSNIVLNYMVDSVQFPNFISKKTSFSRFGQTFEFVNNQEYNGDLTINFSFDMRGIIDRTLKTVAQYSRYYNINRKNTFDIRITNYKPIHFIKNDNYLDFDFLAIAGGSSDFTFYPNDFQLNVKTFKNVQLSSVQNYQLDNKSADSLSKAVAFSYLGVNEKTIDYDFSVDYKNNIKDPDKIKRLSELVYEMYDSIYEYLPMR